MLMINNLCGTPNPSYIQSISDKENEKFMMNLPKRKGFDFQELFKGANKQAIDLLERMLKFDPDQRITVNDALAHPYLSSLHDEDDEPIGEPMSPFDFDFELYSLSITEYRELIYQEILLYSDEAKVNEYLKNKGEYPNGILFKKFDPSRLRTMYKTDKKLAKTVG
jgi:serine/threonine protein kinase